MKMAGAGITCHLLPVVVFLLVVDHYHTRVFFFIFYCVRIEVNCFVSFVVNCLFCVFTSLIVNTPLLTYFDIYAASSMLTLNYSLNTQSLHIFIYHLSLGSA